MSRNGSGVYNLPAGNPVVTGTTISSTWANNTLSDIATALTGSVAADGQTPITGNLAMGGNKLTGLTAGSVSGEYDTLIVDMTGVSDSTISKFIDSGASLRDGSSTVLEVPFDVPYVKHYIDLYKSNLQIVNCII